MSDALQMDHAPGMMRSFSWYPVVLHQWKLVSNGY